MRADQIVVQKHVAVPMRDGVVTRADLYRPADGRRSPAVVVRTPYDKEVIMGALALLPNWVKLAERGYAVLVQDIRGRFSSDGEFQPFVNEARDGHDTVEWVAAQAWCDGNVCVMGASFFGATTLLAASARPPHLRAAIPIITADDYYLGWFYQGGALELGFAATWGAGVAAAQFVRPRPPAPREKLHALLGALTDPPGMLATWPVSSIPGLADREAAPFWHDWIGHPTRDGFWDAISPALHHAEMDQPMLHIGGWYDIFLAGTLRNFTALTASGRAPQKLVIGPWAHTAYDRWVGQLDFGPGAAPINAGVIVDINRWLDRFLAGDTEVDTGPAVRYYLMGANEWRTAGEWPPAGATPQRWYLSSRGRANGAGGDGALSEKLPAEAQPEDVYLYNPANPTPTVGGNTLITGMRQGGPYEQSAVEGRGDVLVYTSAPLERDLVLAGPVRVHLSAATDGPDTDWTAKLCELSPDGRSYNLCDGIIRARYRESLRAPSLLDPGKVYEYDIDLVATAALIRRGHRLRLQISSANFPRFDRNSNTGGDIFREAGWRVAVQRVVHTPGQPSWLEVTALP